MVMANEAMPSRYPRHDALEEGAIKFFVQLCKSAENIIFFVTN